MTDEPAAHWGALLGRSQAAVDLPSDTPEEMVMRALSGGAGHDLLEWLRQTYVENVPRALASEAELREDAACRRLVRKLENMRDRGVEIAQGRAKTA